MIVDNYIETQYRALKDDLNFEFIDLYSSISHEKLKVILATLQYKLVSLFKQMNERLPTDEYEAHFWAEPSRDLQKIIKITLSLHKSLEQSQYSFSIDNYYYELLNKCNVFLSSSGGSRLPAHMDSIILYYTLPIFVHETQLTTTSKSDKSAYSLKLIGGGSYAHVYRYYDDFYQHYFVLKRAKSELSSKELIRFRKEYEEMKEFSSPYIVEVFCYNNDKNEYIMESMDFSLYDYIEKNNDTISEARRKSIISQILRAFEYIHSKKRLHRDINPKNILLKFYEDLLVVKVADFGLIKDPDSALTTVNTEFKGYFNDPSLVVEGFHTYSILHETYALTRLIYYILTGRTNTSKTASQPIRRFIEKGLNADSSKRFQTIRELADAAKVL